MNVEEKLHQLGLQLPPPPVPKGSYCLTRNAGGFITLSGQGPLVAGKQLYCGRIGVDLTPEEGYDAARISALNLLSALKSAVGDLQQVELVKVLGFIVASPDFFDYPSILNGASDLFLSVLGEAGQHSRSAVGVYSLPFNLPVEIELTARIRNA